MTVESHSYRNVGGNPPDVKKYVCSASCICCPISWDKILGWRYHAFEEGCKHVEFECLHDETCPECQAPQLWSFLDLLSCPACHWQTTVTSVN